MHPHQAGARGGGSERLGRLHWQPSGTRGAYTRELTTGGRGGIKAWKARPADTPMYLTQGKNPPFEYSNQNGPITIICGGHSHRKSPSIEQGSLERCLGTRINAMFSLFTHRFVPPFVPPLSVCYPQKVAPDRPSHRTLETAMPITTAPPTSRQVATLTRLAKMFGINVEPAAGLIGADLDRWIDQQADALFEREFAEYQALRAERTQ